jgi:3-isopropylmalate/(R)-2-methylmalate dehydratase small subunit
MLPIRLPRQQVRDLFKRVNENVSYSLTVDLENSTLRDSLGLNLEFSVEPFRKHGLLEGLDEIGLTLRHEEKITRYEAARSAWSAN